MILSLDRLMKKKNGINRKKSLIALIIFLILCPYIIKMYLNIIIENRTLSTIRVIKQKYFKDPSIKTILFWNSMFGDKTFYFNLDEFEKCREKCVATYDRYMMNEVEFDAILFHGVYDLWWDSLPRNRSTNQRYVFVTMESPENRKVLNDYSDNYFNWTMTYALNSDIVWSYASFIEKETGLTVAPHLESQWNTSYLDSYRDNDNLQGKIWNKKKLIIWFRSNCQTKSGREDYVHELENYVSIDKIGNCFWSDRSCPKNKDCFRELIEPNYFFYLSFENSLCQDYVTEKFFNPLKYYVVPVVYGGADYNRFAPPNSYINALDYESPRALAKYLVALSRNQIEYRKYYRWKRDYAVDDDQVGRRTACDLCNSLHKNKVMKIYESISDWYSVNKQCSVQKKLRNQMDKGGKNYATQITLDFS